MREREPINDGQWGHFLLILLLLPAIVFIYFIGVIGGSLVKTGVDFFDPSGKLTDKFPTGFLVIYFGVIAFIAVLTLMLILDI